MKLPQESMIRELSGFDLSAIHTEAECFPIRGEFRIARGSKTEAKVIRVRLMGKNNELTGQGECVPYARYGESLDSVLSQITSLNQKLVDLTTPLNLYSLLPAGAARNAVECAAWDLLCKTNGCSIGEILGMRNLQSLETAFTISLGSAEVMGSQAAANAHLPLLKIKLGTENDIDRLRTVRAAAPKASLIVDANEGWSRDNLRAHLDVCAELGVKLIEQPLPEKDDELLAEINSPVPICADESIHLDEDLERLRRKYQALNIKLDKTGGLWAALKLRERAEQAGFLVMVGCMVGTSLAMAPAFYLAQDVAFVDLDGPLLLSQDRSPAITYLNSRMERPSPLLWG